MILELRQMQELDYWNHCTPVISSMSMEGLAHAQEVSGARIDTEARWATL